MPASAPQVPEPSGCGQHRGVRYERITTDPEVMGGIRGLRIPVATVVAMVAGGMPAGARQVRPDNGGWASAAGFASVRQQREHPYVTRPDHPEVPGIKCGDLSHVQPFSDCHH